ncbi:MAG: group 1 glycosyl transferase [Mucilaginibacter sp.]|nr:group 1 glycosyl transferase [Mucilaginibacter sp.]
MKITLSHPTSNANVRSVAKSLMEAGLLDTFFTSIATFPGSPLDKLANVKLFAELKKRKFDSSLSPYTKIFPWREVGRIFSKKIKAESLLLSETGFFSVDQCYRTFDSYVAGNFKKTDINTKRAAYAYEDGALETFKYAKRHNIKCIYDLPIAYWETGRKLFLEEAERLPAWASTLGGGISDSQDKLDRKTRELELADMVVVPSHFVKNSIPDWAVNKKIVVSPFGTPEITNNDNSKEIKSHNRPLRVLFAGSMGQRKGLGDLFAAMRLLNTKEVELVVMGSLQAPIEFYRNEYAGFVYEPGRPHKDVLALMRTCDVFCLPSIVEGRALVMQEAMSQGLPIIITPNTGGEDLIIEGETGFLIPIRSPGRIAEKITWFLENREKIPGMGAMATLHAQTYTWENYGRKIIESIKVLFD